MSWIIFNADDPSEYWSNYWGWVTDDFDTFSDAEREVLSLPINGQWQQIKD